MKSISRSYAGVLAGLAFVVMLCRGLGHSAAAGETIGNALLAMLGFAVVGGIVGWIAEQTIEESVRKTASRENAT